MKHLSKVMVMLIAVLALSLSVAAVQAQDADPIPIAVGEEASGTLADSTQQYVISLAAGDVIIVDVFSDAFEAAPEILDSENRSLVFAFGNEQRSSVVMTAPADGDYFISVGAFMGATTGDYTVRVRAAEPIMPDTPIEGEIPNAPTAYVLEGAAGTLVSASLRGEGYDAQLVLLDSNNERLSSELQGFSDPAVLEFVLPEDGQYVLVNELWFTGLAEGTFTISYSEIIPDPIEVDTPTTVSMQGTARQYYALGGNAGDVVHFTADSGTTEEVEGIDVDLIVTGPSGEDIFQDRSDGIGFDPAITRVILPEDGFYLIKLVPNDETDESQSGDVTLLVETAELITLDDGPVQVTLGDEDRFEQDFVRFTGEPGASYRLTVVGDRATISFTVNIGEGLFNSIIGNVSNGDRLVLDFTLPEGDVEAGSLIDVSLRQSAFQNTTSYEISVEPLN